MDIAGEGLDLRGPYWPPVFPDLWAGSQSRPLHISQLSYSAGFSVELLAGSAAQTALSLSLSTGRASSSSYDPINQIFVKTFSNVKQRGGFLSLYALILSLGILTTYCLGALLYWRFVSIIPPFINFLLFLALWRIPESPLWLLSNRGTEDCREALQWLRYSDHIIIM